MSMPLFLIGAGFNADAAGEAGPIYGEGLSGRYPIHCRYPLVADAMRLSFGLDRLPAGRSIEDLFAESLARGDYSPFEKLTDALMEADYRIAFRLADDATPLNCYSRFFRTFGRAHFLTFNYDSLVEVFLYRAGLWYPHDGYGVPVEVRPNDYSQEMTEKASTSPVLHLHGTFCLYASEFELERRPGDKIEWLVPLKRPRYVFDPLSITALFAPYERMPPELGFEPAQRRVIAPVPNKAEGMKEAFVREVYSVATRLLRPCRVVVAIGYSFSVLDRASYDPVLAAVPAGCLLLMVAPGARDVAARLQGEYPGLRIQHVDMRFKDWIDAAFVGLPPAGVASASTGS